MIVILTLFVVVKCGLKILETRRLRGDIIGMFKILNGYENIDRNICSHLGKIEVE